MRKKWKDSVQAYIKVSTTMYLTFFPLEFTRIRKRKKEKWKILSSANRPRRREWWYWWKVWQFMRWYVIQFSNLPNRYQQLKQENNCLRQEIQRLKEMEENLRKHILEAQFKHLLDEKDAKIASLNHQIENLKQGDESITQEMESIGQVHFFSGGSLNR